MAKRRSNTYALCHFHTARLRPLTTAKLRKVESKIWSRAGFGSDKVFNLITSYVSSLLDVRVLRIPENRAVALQRVRQAEDAIWDTQVRAGCKIPDYEHVARDADRETKHTYAEKVRKQRLAGRRLKGHR